MVTLCAKECYRQTDGRTDEQIIFYSVTFMYKSFLSYFSFYNQQNSPFFLRRSICPFKKAEPRGNFKWSKGAKREKLTNEV